MAFLDTFAAITQANQPLAPFTHLRIGGNAEYLVTPRTRTELANVVAAAFAEKIPFRVLGIGTNLLVRETPVPGIVVRLTGAEFTGVEVTGKTLRAGGGATLADVVAAAALANLQGFETLVGITATIGGALRCNAGDRSGEMADHLVRIEVLDTKGQSKIREKSELRFGDHASDINDPVILAVEFALQSDRADAIAKRMRRSWIHRKAEQPLSHQAALRAFKNHHGEPARTLLEKAGLARTKIGAAEVSDRNTNYIIAHPGTTAADIIALANKMREAVRTQFGVTLEPEFKVW